MRRPHRRRPRGGYCWRTSSRRQAARRPSSPQITAGDGQAYPQPFFDPHKHPSGDQYAYVVVKEHTLPTDSQAVNPAYYDPLGKKVVFPGMFRQGATLYPDGACFCRLCGESSWWDDLTNNIGDLVPGAVDAIGFIVNRLAAVWNHVKMAVLEVILAAIMLSPASTAPTVHPVLASRRVATSWSTEWTRRSPAPQYNRACRTGTSWKKEMGIDYAAGEVASQTGLPPALTKYLAHQLAERNRTEDGPEPGRGRTAIQLGRVVVQIRSGRSLRDHQQDRGDLPTNLVLALGKSALYERALVPVPAKFPGSVQDPDCVPPERRGCAAANLLRTIRDCHSLLDIIAKKTRWYRNHFRDRSRAQAAFLSTPSPGRWPERSKTGCC